MRHEKLNRKKIVKFISSLVLIMLFFSCSENKEEKATNHFKRGEQYLEEMKYNEALIEFKNVIQLNPNSAHGHYKLGLTYWHLGGLRNLQLAFAEFNKAVNLDQGINDAQLKLAEIHLVTKDLDKSRERVMQVLKNDPENLDAKVINASIMAMEKDFDSAIPLLSEIIEKASGDIRAHMVLASIYTAQGKLDKAKNIYEEAISIKGGDAKPRIALAGLFFMLKDKESAERTLTEALKAVPGDINLLSFLARFYVKTKRMDEAEKVYLEIVKSNPDNKDGYLMLASFYEAEKNEGKALETLKNGLGKTQDSIELRRRIASFLLKGGEKEEASKELEAILKEHKNDFYTLYLRGRLSLLERKFREAIDDFKKSLQSSPNFAEAHLYLGLAYQSTNDLNLAKSEFLEALKLKPGMEKALLPLASIYLLNKDYTLALEKVREVLIKSPKHPFANLIAGDIKLEMKKLEEAARHFKLVKEIYPDDLRSYARLGLVYQFQGKDKDALYEYEKALEVNPLLIDVLRMIIAMHFKNNEPEKAIKRIVAQLDKAPDNASMNHLTGRVYWMTGDVESAEKYFNKSLALDDKRVDIYIDLGKVYSKKGNLDEAVKKFEKAIEISPENLAPYMLLGVIYENKNNIEKATEIYKKVLDINPKFAPAANNLAWIYAENGGNMDVALSLAETAKELHPDDPSISDTLGWIYYKKKTYLKAISLFKESLEKLPDVPSIHYHLGMAYSMKGDADLAREALEKALALSKDFSGSEEAKETLNQINSKE